MWLRSRWFFVVPFVLLMLWFLGNIVFSLAIYRYILGHYEFRPMPYEEITGNETISYSAPGLETVANDMTEILVGYSYFWFDNV
jgi:hypothetical protein